MSQEAESSSLVEWAGAFHEYLISSKYDKVVGQKMRNIHNVYNLLFVHEQRLPHSTVRGRAPEAEDVTDLMVDKKLLAVQEDGSVAVAPKSTG